MPWSVDKRGFTLIELLMAIFLSMIVLSAGYSVFMGSNEATTKQNLENRMMDNARMAMDVLARSFRGVGLLTDFNSYPKNNQLISGLDIVVKPTDKTNGPDSVTIIGGNLVSLGNLQKSVPLGSSAITLLDASSVQAGDVIGIGMSFTAKVASVSGNVVNLATSGTGNVGLTNIRYEGVKLEDGVTSSDKQPAKVRLVQAQQFFVDSTKDPNHPTLMQIAQGSNVAEPLAEDIEDLQIEYGIDKNGNRIIEPAEWMSNPSSSDIKQYLRMVRITIVARTVTPMKSMLGANQAIPAVGNHPAWSTTDGYKRYILTRIIKCRNAEITKTL
ncbi:MAG: PilW family protein [Nitrospiraceae bacterium]|nr:PilW family protein [Nitrospiraceae bacterium]